MLAKFTTLTGIPAAEIPRRLAEPFNDPKAYKGVPGGADLTDINTGFMIERATEVFGPRGLGWELIYEPADLEVLNIMDKRPTAFLKNAMLRYCLVDQQEQAHWFGIQTSGASANELAYAPEGARTAAIGAALKALCFQLPVYKGLLDHHNVARLLAESKAAAKPKPAPPANGSGPGPTRPAPAVIPAAGTDPGSFVIPLGKHQGLTLAEVPRNAVEWYASRMQPTPGAAAALQEAARLYLEVLPA